MTESSWVRVKIIGWPLLIAALLAISIQMRSCTALPPPEPTLAVNTAQRVVVDLLHAPDAVQATYVGQSVTVPGTPTRWLVAELHDNVATVGWTNDPEVAPAETLTLSDRGVRVVAYPLPAPAIAGVEVMPGLTTAPNRPTLRIERRIEKR